LINFDLAITSAHDEGSMTLRDKVEFCHDPLRIVARKITCTDESELPDSFDFG